MSVLIHESLHFLNPSESEAWVRNQEKIVFNSLLPEEFSELLRMLKEVK